MYAPGTKIRLIDCPVEGFRDLGEVFEAAEPMPHVVRMNREGNDLQSYKDRSGNTTHCPRSYWELAGPVVTETVTKTRIVPGVYDGVRLHDYHASTGHVIVAFDATFASAKMDADQLDAAAAVLSALAKGLRDA